MNCYDCTANGNPTAAVATCHDCGAGICQKHASEHDKRITAVFAWSHSAPTDPPQRRIRCTTCAEAINTINEARRLGRYPKAHRP